MAILGNIIKGVINARDAIATQGNREEEQRLVLEDLLKTASNTAFGKEYDFKSLLDSNDIKSEFASRVPYHDYDKMNREWWQRQLEGEEDVSWPGNPSYYALSSGTTGKTSKRIPVTAAMK